MTTVYRIEEILRDAATNAYSDRKWKDYATSRQFIDAIKLLRNMTGAGLKEAKDAVEHWLYVKSRETALEHVFRRHRISNGSTETVSVIEHGDGTFTTRVVRESKHANLSELLKAINSLDH